MRRNRFRSRRGQKPLRLKANIRRSVPIAVGSIGLVLLSLALMAGHDFLTHCRYFSISTIQISGLSRLSEGEVLAQAHIEKGANIMAINLPLTRKRLKAHPWIADVSIRRQIPDALELNITEQYPLAVVDLGRKFVINRQGDIFKKAESSDLNALPVIAGLTYSDLNLSGQPTGPLFGSVMAILKLGREPGSVIPNAALHKVIVDPEIGVTLAAFDQPLIIHLGKQNFPVKYEALTQVLTHFNSQNAALDIGWIDLNDPERIVMDLKGELTQKRDKEV